MERFGLTTYPTLFIKEQRMKEYTKEELVQRTSMRTFDTGATRDSEEGKYDYEGFLSPLVLERFAMYMHQHRKQADGELRDSDNWQKGMPVQAYMKSKWRHFMATWLTFRGHDHLDVSGELSTIEESLCAELFNTMGILHEVLKCKQNDEA